MAVLAEESSIPESSPRYAGWRAVFACFTMAFFAWGLGFFGHSVYLVELKQQHHWSASLISAAVTFYYLTSAVLIIFLNDTIRLWGSRAVALAGAVAFASSMILLVFVSETWQLFGVYFVMAFGWAGLTLPAISSLIGQWFDVRRGLAVSLAMNGAGVAGVVAAPAMVEIATAYGFTAAAEISAGAVILVLIPILAVFARSPSESERGRMAKPVLASRNDDGPAPWNRARALRSLAFWTATAPYALALVAQVGLLTHMVALLEPSVGRATAAWAASISGIFGIVGRVGIGSVIDRLDRRKVFACSLLSQAAALTILISAGDLWALLAACALFGFSTGNVTILPVLIIQQEFDARLFGVLVGLATAIAQVAFAFGPTILGTLRDGSGGYHSALLVCIALQIAAAAIVLVRRKGATV